VRDAGQCVQETVQPASLRLWLKPTQKRPLTLLRQGRKLVRRRRSFRSREEGWRTTDLRAAGAGCAV